MEKIRRIGMDINEARLSVDDYLSPDPYYSGYIEETNDGFEIMVIQSSSRKPRRGREIEDKHYRHRWLNKQVFENLNEKKLQEILEELI